MIDRRSLIALPVLAALATLGPSVARAAAPRAVAFDQDAYAAALAAGTPMLVEITASWCPTCHAQQAVFGDLLQKPRFADLLILDIDFDSQKKLVRAFGARQQSTLIVYSGGREVARSVGETRPARLEALLDAAY